MDEPTIKNNWIADEYLGVKFKYCIDADNKTYSMKIVTHIPRRFYYGYENEIGKMIEEKHKGELK
jgi:hypothetical protein